jgi:adenylate cyclase class IV
MNTGRNTEIEIRGKLDVAGFNRIMAFLKKKAKFFNHYKRISVDLSPGFVSKTRSWKSDNQIDLRVKKSEDSEKISLKIGNVDAKERKEIEVYLKEGGFLDTILLLENLGFDKGMVYFWESWEYLYGKFKVKLSKYTDNYYTWEIESAGNGNPTQIAFEINLKPYTKSEYQNSINWENKNIHKLYSFRLTEKLLKNLFNS